jgi:hypothetical protein
MLALLADVAFLKNWSAFEITLIGVAPALLFTLYVIFDDARQARAHRRESHAGDKPAAH